MTVVTKQSFPFRLSVSELEAVASFLRIKNAALFLKKTEDTEILSEKIGVKFSYYSNQQGGSKKYDIIGALFMINNNPLSDIHKYLTKWSHLLLPDGSLLMRGIFRREEVVESEAKNIIEKKLKSFSLSESHDSLANLCAYSSFKNIHQKVNFNGLYTFVENIEANGITKEQLSLFRKRFLFKETKNFYIPMFSELEKVVQSDFIIQKIHEERGNEDSLYSAACFSISIRIKEKDGGEN